MDIFKKPECVPFSKIKGCRQGKHQKARLESSVTSVSLSTSLSSQQSTCSGFDYARRLYRSVINDSISSNESKILHESSRLHSSVKEFAQREWIDLLNTTKEWQIKAFVERHKEMKTRAARSKGRLHQKMMMYEKWWCVLQEDGLHIEGYEENKQETVKRGPIIKRMDSHTVANQDLLIKLKRFCAERCEPRIPLYIKNRFTCGFPEDWKVLKKKWLMFLKEGEPRDFQWEQNDTATSSDRCSVFQKPSGESSQGSNFEEFTNNSQEIRSALSNEVAKNKFTEGAIRVESNDVTFEKNGAENIANWPYLEEERNNHIAKRNEPQSSNSATITKENFLPNKRSFEIVSEDSENSDSEGADILKIQTDGQDGKSKDKQHGNMMQHSKSNDKQCGNKKQHSKTKDKQYGNMENQYKSKEFTSNTQERSFALSPVPVVAKNKFTEITLRVASNNVTVKNRATENVANQPHLEEERNNHIAKRNDAQSSNSATITKENLLSVKRSFEIVSDSENSDSEGADVFNIQTDWQAGTSKDKQHVKMMQHSKSNDKQCGNMKQHSKTNDKERGKTKQNSKTKAKPYGKMENQSKSKEFTSNTQERSFTLSPVVAKNKFKERIIRADSNNVTVENHATETIVNRPHLEEERNNHTAKRNEPQCSNSATVTNEKFLSLNRSFEVVSYPSENSDSEGADILNIETNGQDGKSKNKQHRNTTHSRSNDKQCGNMKQNSKTKDKQSGNTEKQSKGKGKQLGNKEKSGVRRTNLLMGDEILLKKWLPVLQENELCFRGVRSVGTTENSYTTVSVKSRLKSDTVTLVDGNTCKLIGLLYDEHNCLPEKIRVKFQSGIPQYWRKVLGMWIVYSRSTKAVEIATSGISSQLNNQQQGVLKKSSRGRTLLKPVKHWLGETPSSVIKKLAAHNEEPQVELLNSTCSRPLHGENILSSTSDKEKCELVNRSNALPQKNIKNSVNSKRKKELVVKNVKRSKKEQQPCRPESDKIENSDPLSGISCPDSQFENPTYFADSERRVLRSRNKQIVAQKESSNDAVHGKKSSDIDKNAISCSSQSRNKRNSGKFKESCAIPVLGRNNKDTASAEKIEHTVQKTNKKSEDCPLKPSNISIEFTDFLGKPPRTLKQRKKLNKIVKTLSQNNKKNVDLFDDSSDDEENSRTEWDDFIAVKNLASFNIGEGTPRSKILSGSFFKTPETSPSHSIFQITPCQDDEILKYVHQQKTKNIKSAKRMETKKSKLPFIPTSSGNEIVDDVFATLLKGEPIPQHIISKEMRVGTDDDDSLSDSFSDILT